VTQPTAKPLRCAAQPRHDRETVGLPEPADKEDAAAEAASETARWQTAEAALRYRELYEDEHELDEAEFIVEGSWSRQPNCELSRHAEPAAPAAWQPPAAADMRSCGGDERKAGQQEKAEQGEAQSSQQLPTEAPFAAGPEWDATGQAWDLLQQRSVAAERAAGDRPSVPAVAAFADAEIESWNGWYR
jgi:hypothetical protein